MKNTKIWGFLQKNTNITALLFCIAGIMTNLLLSYLVTEAGLPLYLDTVGTVVVAIVGGYLPGVLVGFSTNLIKTVSDPTAIYYGILNVLIALLARFLSSHGWLKKIRGVFGMIILFSLLCGGLGALIPWFMEGLSFDSESLSGILYSSGYFNLEISHLLSSLIMDFPDKAVTVMLAISIVHLIPEKFSNYCYFNIWMQDPVKGEEYRTEKSEVRRLSLRMKIFLVLIFSLASVAFICIFLSVNVYKKMSINEHTQLAYGTAKLAGEVIDGNHVNSYLDTKGTSDEYIETKKILEKILYSSPEIAYLYVYKMEPEGFRVVFDIDTEDEPAGEVGSLIPYDESFLPYMPELMAGEEVDPIITNDEYGYLLTAASPVYDSNGNCVCYAIADVDMLRLRASTYSFLVEIVSILLGTLILLCTFTLWLTKYLIILPINSIVKGLDKLASTSDSQESMDSDVKLFRSLGIHTGDELENLFEAASRLTKNQTEQMRSIRRLSGSTVKMQDGLIITMADMVESRDSDTGAHIQKTAAYVKIIVEGLKKKGYYPQKITPKFMSDVVRSAPLHDIGKINIPDVVLNKPGRLTEEEYEIMKTHTIAGKIIMEKAISTVEGDSYLKEARNMAAYHHERWDGKGYPEGIHGEVIPLSARIMAVADVFDALTSERVYKPAYSLEKALIILEEGKGTQFDPKCIEVFMDALPDVKKVLREFNQENEKEVFFEDDK